ncbi:hypothetical protein C8Q72DRAFT_782428 [Fomitopsis betulina]|nr:hypothetical protein C8Q72DRAFT_782428 [Fomitopsis betulina]
MHTNLEHAISAVLTQDKELTVHNVLVDYLRVTGYTVPGQKEVKLPHDALVAFEHALDKEPLLRKCCRSPDAGLCTRMYTKEITALRKEYWVGKLGSSCCTCPSCGCMVAYEKGPEAIDNDDAVLQEKRRVRRKAKNRRIAKRLRDTTRNSLSMDPYGPSTSAFMI